MDWVVEPMENDFVDTPVRRHVETVKEARGTVAWTQWSISNYLFRRASMKGVVEETAHHWYRCSHKSSGRQGDQETTEVRYFISSHRCDWA